MHLPGDFTRVVLFELGDGCIRLDIPTERIPKHLRHIGAAFLVIQPRFAVEDSDSPEAAREMCAQVDVEELPES